MEKECIGCKSKINKNANVCKHCGVNQRPIIQFFNTYNSLIAILFSILFFFLGFLQFQSAIKETIKAEKAKDIADNAVIKANNAVNKADQTIKKTKELQENLITFSYRLKNAEKFSDSVLLTTKHIENLSKKQFADLQEISLKIGKTEYLSNTAFNEAIRIVRITDSIKESSVHSYEELKSNLSIINQINADIKEGQLQVKTQLLNLYNYDKKYNLFGCMNFEGVVYRDENLEYSNYLGYLLKCIKDTAKTDIFHDINGSKNNKLCTSVVIDLITKEIIGESFHYPLDSTKTLMDNNNSVIIINDKYVYDKYVSALDPYGSKTKLKCRILEIKNSLYSIKYQFAINTSEFSSSMCPYRLWVKFDFEFSVNTELEYNKHNIDIISNSYKQFKENERKITLNDSINNNYID